ncbi:unnamed protein product [Somion occarium]|uniref:Uncharacterized protein n=1 Tax=Somion occarium TaxID=3059160 RepID=A0ABP1DSD1_9APHY
MANGVRSLTPGMLVASNSSEDLQTITLAEADDLAVLQVVKPNVPQPVAFRATTFGARVSCQSVNHLCVHGYAPQNCSGFSSTFPPISGFDSGGLNGGESKVFIQSPNCPWDVDCDHISADMITSLAAALSSQVPPVNAYSLWMPFLWEAAGDTEFGHPPEGNDAIDNYSNLATMVTNCTLYFYNVTLDYSNGSYVRVDEELTNVGLSDGLAASARLGHYASHLISNVQGHAFTDNSTDKVMAYTARFSQTSYWLCRGHHQPHNRHAFAESSR